MRFSTVAFTLFGAAASASASTLIARQATYPNCAVPCTVNANFNGCAPTDNHCLCTNQGFLSSTTACVQAACTGQDLADALSFSQTLCLKVGVTLSAPASTAPATTGSASSAASATPAATSAHASSGAGSAAPSSTAKSGAASSHQINAFLGLAGAGLLALAL